MARPYPAVVAQPSVRCDAAPAAIVGAAVFFYFGCLVLLGLVRRVGFILAVRAQERILGSFQRLLGFII